MIHLEVTFFSSLFVLLVIMCVLVPWFKLNHSPRLKAQLAARGPVAAAAATPGVPMTPAHGTMLPHNPNVGPQNPQLLQMMMQQQQMMNMLMGNTNPTSGHVTPGSMSAAPGSPSNNMFGQPPNSM